MKDIVFGVSALATAVGLAVAVPAHAQDANATAANRNEAGEGLVEIVVTANRTESAAQKTPISLSVYTGEDLAAAGVSDFASLATKDPGINFTNNAGRGYAAVRGVASADTTEIGDPSVPISRDGFYSNRAYALQLSMYDVNRVEVLKGPQGTLNGRNSTGGLVNIITNRPTGKNGGYGSVEVGNYGTFNGELGVNLAISDLLSVRASGIFRHHNGYRRAVPIGLGLDDEDAASGRIQILLKPFEGLSIWASYQHDNIDNNGPAVLRTPPPAGIRPDFGDAETVPGVAPVYNRLSGDRFRWEVVYDALPLDMTLTYLGGYEDLKFDQALESTDVTYPAIRQFRRAEKPRTTNHEIRIANPSGNRFSFQAGYFHFNEVSDLDSGAYNLNITDPTVPQFPNQYGLRFQYHVRSKSDAVFGQVGFRVTEQVKFSLGGRYTWDEKVRTGFETFNFLALLNPNFFPPPFAPTGTTVSDRAGAVKYSQATYHVGLDYNPTDTNLLYAKFSTGFKSGGFNTVAGSAQNTYDPEVVKAFEIGSKNRFMDNRLQLNLAAFYMDYSNYQASQIIQFGAQTTNTGSAKIKGLEAEFTALVGKGGQFNLNTALLDTKFDKGVLVARNNTVQVDIGGNELPNAPKFSLSAAYEQKFDIASGHVSARIDGKYTSSFQYSLFNDADVASDDSLVLNASLGYSHGNGVWEITAFVRNLTDQVVLSRAGRNGNLNINEYEFQPPRTYGVRGSFRF